MEQMGAVNLELEDICQDKKRVRNPFVPIGTCYGARLRKPSRWQSISTATSFASSVNGGHFAGCVVDGNSLVAHKTFPRFPFVACDIFTCEVDLILKALVEDEELDMLFSFLDPKHPHSSQGLASKLYNFKKGSRKLYMALRFVFFKMKSTRIRKGRNHTTQEQTPKSPDEGLNLIHPCLEKYLENLNLVEGKDKKVKRVATQYS